MYRCGKKNTFLELREQRNLLSLPGHGDDSNGIYFLMGLDITAEDSVRPHQFQGVGYLHSN